LDWIKSLTKAIHYIENNLTRDISTDDVANTVYVSGAHFQRVFNLVTGMTLGDYIRNRRLSLAGQELLHPKNKLFDIATKYRYETQESFSKAFTRFHGVNPSNARKQSSMLKQFRALTINITIQGGFNMSRKLIDHLPLHQLQYPEQGQNYVFNGCMKFLMECIGENEAYDYWFFATVSGDIYVQVFGTDKTYGHNAFSDCKYDYALLKRVFDAVGYDFTYMDAAEWRRDKDKCKAKLMEYIDKGIPIIGKGFDMPSWEFGYTNESSCVVGYENDGECFYRLPEEATDLIPFTLDDEFPYTFAFIEAKKDTPPIAEVYRNALLNAPRLMQTPSEKNIYFGAEAFRKWADCIEGDFYRTKPEEFHYWMHYGIMICITATNIFHKRDTTDRAIQMNPDLARTAPLLDNEYKALCNIENRLKEAEGYFNVTFEVLQDPAKCKEIASIMRQIADVHARICDILKQIS
jgi:AraC-like DNA-binding protein